MTEKELRKWIEQLIEIDRLDKFYKSPLFVRLRSDVLKEQQGICQICRRTADTVHHVMHVREYPELALSKYFWNPKTRQKEKNLIAVCRSCHNDLHPEKWGKKSGIVNEERW